MTFWQKPFLPILLAGLSILAVIGAFIAIYPQLKCNGNDLCFETFLMSDKDRATILTAYERMTKPEIIGRFETGGAGCRAENTRLLCTVRYSKNYLCVNEAIYVFSFDGEKALPERLDYPEPVCMKF
jgi:hypothetical protein